VYYSFDIGFISNIFSGPPDQVLLNILFMGGWIPFALVFLWGAKEMWLDYISGQFAAQQKYVLLAIDIPRGNAESLKNVESLFAYLAGAHGSNNLIDTYWLGKFQLSFSFEIVSIDGYTQFLIRTPVAFKNLTESAVYSVYPDAEISEVNDYTENVPSKYPDSEYDLWGSEFVYVKSDAYPIKTYPAFEDPTSPPETHFKDPMALLMDLNSSLRPGEQLWFQMLLYPTDGSWVTKSEGEVASILKEKPAAKKGVLDHLIDVMIESITSLGSLLSISGGAEAPKKDEKKDEPLKMISLKPKEKKQVEAIQAKASKIGFECKIRMIYVAKKDVINKPKVVNGFVGYIKQFIDWDLNNLKPDMAKTATSVSYFFKDARIHERQNKIIKAYKSRSGTVGRVRKIFNTEELATLWHFPIEAVVKAPLIQKAPGRKSEPPMTLPLEENFADEEDDTSQGDFDIFEDEVLEAQKYGEKDSSAGLNKEAESQKNNNALPDFFLDDEPPPNKKNDAPGNLPFV
jgi:hypothetical protein